MEKQVQPIISSKDKIAHLLPRQKEALKTSLKFLAVNKGCLNASEMGTGKTIMTIATADVCNWQKVLIICPAVMRLVWEEELIKWQKITRSIVTILKTTDLYKVRDQDVIIVGYDVVSKPKVLDKLLYNKTYDLLVCDESHYLKNEDALRTRAVFDKYWKKANYRILLTGTPFTKSLADGFTSFSALLPHVFSNFYKFTDRYMFSRYTSYGTEYYGSKNTEELKQIIRSNFYLRLLKKDVQPDMPVKLYKKILLDENYSAMPKTKAQRNLLEAETKSIVNQIKKGKAVMPTSDVMNSYRIQQALDKIPAVRDLIEPILEANESLIIFTWHKEPAKQISQLMDTLLITGETNPRERMNQIKLFQQGANPIIVCTIAAAATGITLTKANHVVFLEQAWTPASNQQAEARAHRIGTKSTVYIYNVVVKNTIDEIIFNVVKSRQNTFELVIGDQ